MLAARNAVLLGDLDTDVAVEAAPEGSICRCGEAGWSAWSRWASSGAHLGVLSHPADRQAAGRCLPGSVQPGIGSAVPDTWTRPFTGGEVDE